MATVLVAPLVGEAAVSQSFTTYAEIRAALRPGKDVIERGARTAQLGIVVKTGLLLRVAQNDRHVANPAVRSVAIDDERDAVAIAHRLRAVPIRPFLAELVADVHRASAPSIS